MKEAASYDPIASFYDDHWTERYQPLAFEILRDVLLETLAPGASILDVGCGTGVISQSLSHHGYRVVGIDISPEMVRHARMRSPDGDFRVADARQLRVQQRFDAAVSLFDTLNHILVSEEMLSVFRNVHDALTPSGVFVFDLNMQEAYETQWSKWSAHVDPDEVCIVRGGYDAEARLGRTEITLFSRKSGWQRNDVLLKQRCYGEDEIIQLLHAAGFETIDVHAAAALGMRDADLATGRSFFVGRIGRSPD